MFHFIASYTAEYLGFTSYPPPYLSQEAQGKNLLQGANFASASSGYYDRTAQLYVNNEIKTISLSLSLCIIVYLFDYKNDVFEFFGVV